MQRYGQIKDSPPRTWGKQSDNQSMAYIFSSPNSVTHLFLRFVLTQKFSFFMFGSNFPSAHVALLPNCCLSQDNTFQRLEGTTFPPQVLLFQSCPSLLPAGWIPIPSVRMTFIQQRWLIINDGIEESKVLPQLCLPPTSQALCENPLLTGISLLPSCYHVPPASYYLTCITLELPTQKQQSFPANEMEGCSPPGPGKGVKDGAAKYLFFNWPSKNPSGFSVVQLMSSSTWQSRGRNHSHHRFTLLLNFSRFPSSENFHLHLNRRPCGFAC